MPPNSRVELYAAIRRDARAGVSSREIQRKHGVGWRTVQAAVASAWPPQRAAYPTRASKLDVFKPVIDDILRASLDAPRKQRHTVTRIVDRLRTEYGMDDVSYPVVRAYVAKRRPEISVECGRGVPGAFVPQTHLPGREAEVDFGEIGVRLRGQLVTCCSRCECHTPAGLFIGHWRPEDRRRSSRVTCTLLRSSAELHLVGIRCRGSGPVSVIREWLSLPKVEPAEDYGFFGPNRCSKPGLSWEDTVPAPPASTNPRSPGRTSRTGAEAGAGAGYGPADYR